MSRKKLASQFAWVSIGRLLGALIQAITILLLARDLGPHSFGVFSAIFGVAIVFQAGLDFGIANMVVRERAIDPASPMIYSALRLADNLGITIFFVTAVPLFILAVTIDPFLFYLLPLAVWAACERHADIWLSVPLADGDARINTQNLLMRRIVAILLYIGAVSAGLNPAFAFSVSMALTAAASMIVVRKIVRNRITAPFRTVGYREIIKDSWPYWLNSLGTQARNLDTLVVSAVAGASQAGFYAATSRATGPLRILSSSLAAVMLPASASKNRRTADLIRIVAVMAAFCCILYGGLVLVVPMAVTLFLGSAYQGAVFSLQIVLAGLVFAAIASLFTSILQGFGHQLFVAKVSVINTVVCLFAVGVGGATAGAVGAAWALSISFGAQAATLGSKIIAHVDSKKQPHMPALQKSLESS